MIWDILTIGIVNLFDRMVLGGPLRHGWPSRGSGVMLAGGSD